MKVHSPAPGVTQLTRFGAFACHLVETGEGLVLVDTGLPGGAGAILAAIARAGAPLAAILVTHGHADHCGALDRVARAWPGAVVAASARTARLLAGERAPEPEDGGRPLRGSFARCATRPTRILREGEEFAGFRVVETPGHAPGHLSFFEERTGFLFTGDTVHTSGGRLAVSGDFRPWFPFPAFATFDRVAALDSARKIRDLSPSALFPAHAAALFAPTAALDDAIRHADKALGRRSLTHRAVETP